MRKTLAMMVFALATAGFLAGCGYNSDDGYNGGYAPAPMLISYVGTTDAFVSWGDPISGDFASAPTGSYAGKRQSLRGTVDPLTGASLGQAAGVEVYKYSDGHLHALDLTGYGEPTAQQISSESGATIDDTCSFTGTAVAGATSEYVGVYFAGDLANPMNDSYFYRLPGPDGVCNTADDVFHMVKTAMSAGTAPITTPAMPLATVHSAQGAITGFVAKSGSSLLLYDSNFSNPLTLGSFSAPIGVAVALPTGLASGFPSGQLFLVDGNIVYVNYAVPGISATLYTVPNWTSTAPQALFAASPSTLYMAINTPAAGSTPASASIYAVPADGSAAPSVIDTQAGSVVEMAFPLGATNLVYATLSGTYGIFVLPQGGGTASAVLSSTQNSGSFTATATSIYYTTWTTVTDAVNHIQTRSATGSGIVGVNGSVVRAPLANSSFVAGGEAVPWPLDGSPVVQTALETMLQVQGLTPVTVVNATTGWTYTSDGVSGGTLVAINAASNQVVTTLGTLPISKAMYLQGVFRSSDDTGFISATNAVSTQNAATRDQYLINTQITSSVERVTNNL